MAGASIGQQLVEVAVPHLRDELGDVVDGVVEHEPGAERVLLPRPRRLDHRAEWIVSGVEGGRGRAACDLSQWLAQCPFQQSAARLDFRDRRGHDLVSRQKGERNGCVLQRGARIAVVDGRE